MKDKDILLITIIVRISTTIIFLCFFVLLPYMAISLIGTEKDFFGKDDFFACLFIFSIPICLFVYNIYVDRVIVPREERMISLKYIIPQEAKSGVRHRNKSLLTKITAICETIIYLCFFVSLFYMAISLIGIGKYGYALIFLSFPICLLAYIIYVDRVIVPREEKKITISLMYNIPQKVKSGECHWDKSFLKIIETAIENITAEDKKNDLEQCGKIVKKMTDEKSFDDLHRAFRLTGCHMKITDDNGKLITKIV